MVAEQVNTKKGPAAARDGPGLSILVGKAKEIIQEAIADPVTYLANWGRVYSLWPVHLETACCSIEWGALSGPRFDAERFGTLEAFGSLRQCDLIVVHGTVTRKMAPRLRWIYDQMPEPKWVIAMGACLRGDSLVYCSDGPKQIKSVQKNDRIFSYDEDTRSVVESYVNATKCNGERGVFRLRAGSYETVATDDHLFAVYTYTITKKWKLYETANNLRSLEFTSGEIAALLGVDPKTLSYWKNHPPEKLGLGISWKRLDQLEERDFVVTYSNEIEGNVRIINYKHEGKLRNQVSIPTSVTDDLAWILGMYLGDGWNNGNRVGLSVPPADKVRLGLERTLFDLFKQAPSLGEQVALDSKAISGTMKQSLELDGDVHTKRMPWWMFTATKSQVLQFIAGLVDSDGYVSRTGFAQVSSMNQAMLANVVELCHYRNISVSGIFHKQKENDLEGRHLISTEYIISFPKSVVTALPIRKKRQPMQVVHSSTHTSRIRTNHSGISVQHVTSIIPRGKELVYDIEVKKYHNFFANGQLVHNCSITGGVYFDSYNVLPGVDQVVPVDVYVPGCPPRPEELIDAIVLLQDKIRKSSIR